LWWTMEQSNTNAANTNTNKQLHNDKKPTFMLHQPVDLLLGIRNLAECFVGTFEQVKLIQSTQYEHIVHVKYFFTAFGLLWNLILIVSLDPEFFDRTLFVKAQCWCGIYFHKNKQEYSRSYWIDKWQMGDPAES